MYKTDNAPIRLSYHGGVHYNSVVDPYKATIGVGLGLAGYKPGVSVWMWGACVQVCVCLCVVFMHTVIQGSLLVVPSSVGRPESVEKDTEGV